MSIVAAELVLLGSLNRPEDDVAASGGGVDADNRPVFTQMAANDTLEVVSSSAGDVTQSITITGRNAAGALVSDTKTLTGVSAVAISGTFERVLKAVLSADCAGIVTVRRSSVGPTLSTIPIGERGFFAMFISSASESSGVNRYEKIFWKNTNASLTLNVAVITLTVDPSSRIKIGLAASKDDTGSVANRKAAPGGVAFVDDGVDINVPGTTLEAASGIGTWVQQGLLSSDAPFRSTFTTQLAGTSV